MMRPNQTGCMIYSSSQHPLKQIVVLYILPCMCMKRNQTCNHKETVIQLCPCQTTLQHTKGAHDRLHLCQRCPWQTTLQHAKGCLVGCEDLMFTPQKLCSHFQTVALPCVHIINGGTHVSSQIEPLLLLQTLLSRHSLMSEGKHMGTQ
jgi:hypothetical protein